MTIRVTQSSTKAAIDSGTDGTERVTQVSAKAAIDSGAAGTERVTQVSVKFVVKTYKESAVLKVFPPFDTTISQAPYIRTLPA